MNKPVKVSVILPFHNAQDTLATAIQSILNQSFEDFELILVDNKSTDESAEVAKNFHNKDARIVFLLEQQRGVVHAANKGLAHAAGEYIARMDADDFSYPNRLELQVALLDTENSLGMISGSVEYDGELSNGGFIRYIDWLNNIKTPEEVRLNQFVEYPMVNPSIMFRSELYREFGGYKEGAFPEDYEFFLRLQANSIKMGKVNGAVLKWADSPARLTRTDSRYSREAFFEIKAAYLAKWLAKNNPYHPLVWVWGSGRVSRRRSDYLKSYGIEIVSYIDIIDSTNDSVIHFTELQDRCFILSYVSSWGARDEIRAHLNQRGFKEGDNYLICA